MTATEALRQTAAEFGITLADLRGPRRWRHIVNARTMAAVRLRAMGYSYPFIGMVMHRHHTTVMNLVGARRAA